MQPYNRDVRSTETMARDATASVVDTASHLADKAASTFEDVKKSANDLAADAADKGRAAGHQIEAVAVNLRGAIDKSVHEQPMATLAMAAAVGFVVGALWKS